MKPPPPEAQTHLRERLAQLLEATPAAAIAKNSRAVAESLLARLNVVNREEFDAHCEMLANATARLQEMEQKIVALEEQAASATTAQKTTARRQRGQSSTK